MVIADVAKEDFDFGDITYTWECKQDDTIDGPFSEDCDDPDGIFGVVIEGNNQLIIPGAYRGSSYAFKISVYLKDDDVDFTTEAIIVNSFIILDELLPPSRCRINFVT